MLRFGSVKIEHRNEALQEIEGIQDRLRTLAKEYKEDFIGSNALDGVIDKDLQAAVSSLELLKGFYKSKTDRKG